MPSAPIPALREELQVRFRADGTVDVRDPRLLQLLTLDAKEFRLAQNFDGKRGPEQLSADLSRGNGRVTAKRIRSVADEFEELWLLDTPKARTQEPLRENLSPYAQTSTSRRRLKVLPQPLDEPRWSCRACGACCHGLTVEITRAEEARIRPELYEDLLGGESFAEWSFLDPEQPAKRVLRQMSDRNNACIFLDERGLCSVHARQGMRAKPDACQIYPHVVMQVPGGPPRLTLRLNCESMHETFEDGATTASQVDEVMQILETHPTIRAPSEVDWFGETIKFKAYDEIVTSVIHRFTEEDVGPESLRAVDAELLGGRARRARRRLASRLKSYVRRELEGPLPIEEGGYLELLARVPNYRDVLDAMGANRVPPVAAVRTRRFITRQANQALYGLGPLHLPDAGLALTAFILSLEAVLHAVGPRGRPKSANRAFASFTAPLLETTHHSWPFLEALDPEYAEQLMEEL